jgi:rhamnose transport system permease protein
MRVTTAVKITRTLVQRPEVVPAVLLLGAFVAGGLLSPYFLDVHNLLDSTSDYMETGLMALAMTLVIVSGNIDLSVAAMLALVAAISAKLFDHGVSMAGIVPLALVTGAALGCLNGLLITGLKLPSLTVTLGTLALYRGLAQVLLGDKSVGHFPDWFVGIDYRRGADLVPAPLIIFLLLAVAFAMLLHGTVLGRYVYAIGTNESAARFSGVRVGRVKLAVFTISGLMSGAAALMMMSRLGVARYDLAGGDELAVITAVVLGGIDIFGGRGTIGGAVVAVFLTGVMRKAMGLANIRAENQLAVNGALLIAAVLMGNVMSSFFLHQNAKVAKSAKEIEI